MIVLTKCLLTEWQGTSLIAFNNRQQVPANRICRPDGTGPPTNRNKRHPCVICSKDSPIETNDGACPTRLSWMQCRRFVAKSDSTTKFSQIMRFTIKLTAVISIYRYRRRKKVFSIGPGGGYSINLNLTSNSLIDSLIACLSYKGFLQRLHRGRRNGAFSAPWRSNIRPLHNTILRKLDGIIAHLTRQCGGNVHDKGIVNVTASSCYNKRQPKTRWISGKT